MTSRIQQQTTIAAALKTAQEEQPESEVPTTVVVPGPKELIAQCNAAIAEKKLVISTADTQLLILKQKADLGVDVSAEMSATIDVIATHRVELSTLEARIKQINDETLNKAKAAFKAEIAEKAKGKHVDISFIEDPTNRASVYASMAQSCQFQLIYNEDYFGWLAAQVNGRKFGTDTGVGESADSIVPEISIDRESQFYEMRDNRRQLEVARVIFEGEYRQAVDDIPARSQFRPALYFRTDEQVRQANATKSAARIEARREENAKITAAARDYAMM